MIFSSFIKDKFAQWLYRMAIIIFYPLFIPVRTHATIGLSRSGRKRCT